MAISLLIKKYWFDVVVFQDFQFIVLERNYGKSLLICELSVFISFHISFLFKFHSIQFFFVFLQGNFTSVFIFILFS